MNAARPYVPGRHAVIIPLLKTFLDLYAVSLKNVYGYLLLKMCIAEDLNYIKNNTWMFSNVLALYSVP